MQDQTLSPPKSIQESIQEPIEETIWRASGRLRLETLILVRWIAIAGIALTAINMFGGFAVTRRMLAMFQK